MNQYVAQHIARTRSTPLGSRQRRILNLARICEAKREPFPTPEQIRQHLNYRGLAADIERSLLGLQARGLIEATTRVQRQRSSMPAGWRITEAGRKA